MHRGGYRIVADMVGPRHAAQACIKMMSTSIDTYRETGLDLWHISLMQESDREITDLQRNGSCP